jgi:hypothetical protein
MRQLGRFSGILVWFFWVVAAGATAWAQFAGGAAPGPSLTGFSPTQGAQGSSVNITFTGKNFVNKGLSLKFTPAAGVTVQSLQMVSAMQISARVQIDAAAQPGARAVLLIDAGRSLQSQLPFVVTGAPPCGTPGAPPCPGGNGSKTEPPVLREFSPIQGAQGSDVTVTFTGANFLTPANAQLTPGLGITIQSTKVVNGNEIQVLLAIDASAPLGARAVSVVVGKTRLEAQNAFTVVEGPMQILRVVPNEIPAGGENIELTLEGRNFAPTTQVSFTRTGLPTEIQVVGLPRYVDSSELHVTVNVLPTALLGGRDINLETPGHQTATAKGMLNVLPPAGTK